MSELKAYGMNDPEVGDEYEMYKVSDVDKLLAEKDKEIKRLENLCESYRIDCDNLAIREANAYKEIERDNKQIRHQKYKRCLAVARRCHNESLWWYSKGYGFEKYDKFWEKWEKRWLELADKFKPNKE